MLPFPIACAPPQVYPKEDLAWTALPPLFDRPMPDPGAGGGIGALPGMGKPKPRNPRHFDGITGGRKRVSDI